MSTKTNAAGAQLVIAEMLRGARFVRGAKHKNQKRPSIWLCHLCGQKLEPDACGTHGVVVPMRRARVIEHLEGTAACGCEFCDRLTRLQLEQQARGAVERPRAALAALVADEFFPSPIRKARP